MGLFFIEPCLVPSLPDRHVSKTVFKGRKISKVFSSRLQLVEDDASQMAMRPLHGFTGQQNLVDCAQPILGHHQDRQPQFRGERLDIPISGQRCSPSPRTFDNQHFFPTTEIDQVPQPELHSFLPRRQHRCNRSA